MMALITSDCGLMHGMERGQVRFVCQNCAGDSSRFEQVAKRQRGGGATGSGTEQVEEGKQARLLADLKKVPYPMVEESDNPAYRLFLN